MSDRDRIVGRIDPEIKKQFQEFVEETTGGHQGDQSRLMERALVEYMDNDRSARIESKVDDVLDRLDEMESPPPPRSDDKLERERQSTTSSNDPLEGYNKRTKEAITAIAADLPDDAKVKDYSLVSAIEKNAGTSPKTIKKYKNLLRKTGLAIPNPLPDEDLIYTGPTRLALACENDDNITPGHIDGVVGEYIDVLGEDWYLEALPNDYIKNNKLDYDHVFDSSDYRHENGLMLNKTNDKTFQ